MAKVYSIEGVTPVVHPSAFVHPTAVLIGDVIVGPRAYIAPHASLRGDFGRIVIGEGANVQDNCTMHSYPSFEAVVEADGLVGHGAVLHGCRVGRNAMVGMNAVVMDGAVIEENAFVAAMAFVKAGFIVPRQTLAAGIPAKILRPVTDEEVAWKSSGTRDYQRLVERCHASLVETDPLTDPEPNRGTVEAGEALPLSVQKKG